jgi:hypothetical protein
MTFTAFQTLTAAELNAAFAAVTPPATASLIGSTSTAFVVVNLGTGLAINSGTLTPNWQLAAVTALGSGVAINSGTISATGSGGSVTSVVAGVGLNGGTITGAGTLTANYQAGTLTSFGTGLTLSAGALASNYQAGSLTTFHSGLTLSAGTLTPDWNAGVATVLGDGIGINSGTIQADHQVTVAGGGTVTLTPTIGVTSVLLNGNVASATTLQVAAPNYVGQHLRVQYKNGATTQALALGNTILLGSTVASFTSTPTAAVSDFLQLIGANGSQWALVAISQGFTI